MSHLVKKACNLQDISTLLEAAQALGWLVTENAKATFFYGQSEICEYVLIPQDEVKDNGDTMPYTIGVKVEEGKIQLLYDNAMNSRSVMYGDEEDSCTQRIIGKLKQSYQVVSAQKVAKKHNWRIKQEILADGKIVHRIQVR